MSVYRDGNEGISAGSDVTINLHECSVKGGERIILSFSSPLPNAEMLLVFRGSNGRHEVVLERNGPTVLYATVPAHRVAETIDLFVCYRAESGEQRTLYQTKFAYTVDEKQFMAELLVQSVSESGVPLQYSLLPPLPTADALREFDCSLTEALQEAELPTGWTLVGYGAKPLMSIDDYSPRETLLHFAARHSFNSLVRHLLTLPGAEVAALLPNEKGEEPLSIARMEGNEGLVQLLTMFHNQIRSPTLSESPGYCFANGATEPCADPPGEGEGGGDCEAMPWERSGAIGDIVGRKRNREELQKINDEWVKRHKSSTGSLGHIQPLDHTVNGRNRAPAPPIPNGRSDPPKRRSSVAIMDSTHYPHLGRATPIGSVKFNVNDPVVAEMDRLRKVSWSRVVGCCKSRSVGTGLNELDRITAEDTLQKKVDAELEQHKEKTSPSQYSLLTLNQDQLNLLYRLSTSCPALNKDKESVSYSGALSAMTSPRFGSPFSEMEDDGQSSDLVESCSPQLPYHLLAPSLGTRSESSFSRTNTDSSTSSRVQKTFPIPEVITTDYTTLSTGVATNDSPSVLQQLEDDDFLRPRTESEATLVVQRNGNSNNSEGVDGGDSSDADNEVSISWVPVTKSLSSSLIKLSEELGGDLEGEGDDGESGAECLEAEGGVTASASAPDLLAIAREEKFEPKSSPPAVDVVAVAESTSAPGTEGPEQVHPSSRAPAENQPQRTVRDGTEREPNAHFESSIAEEAEPRDSEGKDDGTTVVGSEPQSPSTPTAQTATRRGTSQRNISSLLKKRHRRSLSTSEVEVSSPKDHAHFPLDASEEEEEGAPPDARGRGYSNWETSLTCMQNAIAEGSQSLTIEKATSVASGCSSQRGTDVDDRSRASSFLTNETSSQRESDGSSDEDLYLSAKESVSRTSLEQAMALQNDVMGIRQPNEQENGGSGPNDRSRDNGSGYQLQLPSEEHDGVVLRSGSRKKSSKMISSLNRYSADFQITNIDEFGESSEGESNHSGQTSPPKRRHKSTDVISETCSEDRKLGAGKPPSGASSGGSPSLAQDRLHPRSGKMSTPGADSVFEHDLSPSDVDVKMASDDSLSLSQSFEGSGLQHSPGSASMEGGSPKEFGKRRKSPHFLSGRKNTVQKFPTLESPTRNRKPGGLTKEDVGPTIQTLRGLMTSPTNHSWSDDSDTTIGPDTFRIGSLNAPKSNLQRSESTLSDSLVYQQQKAQLDNPGREILRSASPEGSGGYTSLDSPQAKRYHQPHLVDTPKHPPSPLSHYHARSPVLGNRNTTLSPGPSPGHGSRLGPTSRFRSTMSFDESVLERNDPSRHVARIHASIEATSLENQEVLKEVPEEELESSLDATARKPKNGFQEEPHVSEEGLACEQRSRMQKIFGGIRGSGRTKKPPKEKTARPKSGKLRQKSEGHILGEEEIHFVHPDDYHQQSNLKRSESMQTNFGKSRTLIAPRQGSEGAISPLQKHHGSTHSLTPLVEVVLSSSAPQRAPSQDLPPTSDSEMAADEEEIPTLVSAVSYPELALCEEQTWDKTVDRRIYKKLNKAERERQAIIHELLQTEKSHLRALNVLKLIFRLNISKTVSEEVVAQLFPELDNLLEISEGFIKRLEERKDSSRQVNIFGDISDVLLKQFSGEMRERMLHTFGRFCSTHLTATEIYKEHLKKKHFSRLMKGLHILKECNRLTLPDYYTQVSQRLAKLVTLHRRLVRKTEALKLEHAPQLRESMDNLQTLVAAVDQMVEDHKNQMELLDIQGKLEISVPKSAKGCSRKEIKSLSLVAQERKLRKRGEAEWKGHGRHLSVHVVLVTDLLVFLTERDQKYHLAALQDLKPPVIRLYDLHVRLNAAVKSGVQLLLLEQGEFPEMFRLEFQSKKEAKGWEATLNSAVEECKEKGLKCEFFGVERVVSGDEERRSEEKEGESEGEGEGVKKDQNFPSPSRNPSLRRWQRARESLDLAVRLLGGVSSSLTADADAAQRHTTAAGVPVRYAKESPRNRRALTVALRPKTVYDDMDGTATGDHGSGGKAAKVKGQKKKVERSKTFRDKDKEKDKDKDKVEKGGGAGDGGGGWRIPEQQYVDCITALKDSLEDVVNDYEQQNKLITRLQKEVDALQEFQKAARREEKEGPPLQHPSRNSSPRGSPQQRPRSCHIELSDDHPGGVEEERGVATEDGKNKTSDTGT